MTTTKIEVLPGALELTPAERAWDTYDYLIKHPEGWNQQWYGNRMPDGAIHGCFAHHVVARAGFRMEAAHPAYPTSVMYITIDQLTEPIDMSRTIGVVSRERDYQVYGYVSVPQLAQHLLGYNVGAECPSCDEPHLFCTDNTIDVLRARIANLFGSALVAA